MHAKTEVNRKVKTLVLGEILFVVGIKIMETKSSSFFGVGESLNFFETFASGAAAATEKINTTERK